MTCVLGPRGVLLAAVLHLGCAAHRPDGKERTVAITPDAVYLAERIWTLDEARPVAQALWISGGGKVRATGSREEILRAAGPSIRRVELSRATIVPGITDAHAHLAWLGKSLAVVALNEARSAAEVVARLRQAPPASFQGDWLVGRGWDQNDWGSSGDFPDAALLDEAFPHTPVYLTRVDGHAAWVNAEAMRRAGISERTVDPSGGLVVRDSTGQPTGVLVDNAMQLVGSKLPPLTPEQLAARLEAAIARCLEVGLTSVHDAGMDLETFTQLQHWDAVGALPLRIEAMADGQNADAQTFLERGRFNGRMLRMQSVKLLLDGALGSRGAAMHEPYSDAPGQRGLLLLTAEDFEARARAFMERGFQVAVHAIGDRANTLAVNVLGKLGGEVRESTGRHRIEHAQILRPSDIPRLAKHGLIASMQPTHATSDLPWAEARLGKDRLAGAYAWQSMVREGVKLALGSDFPVEDPQPLLGFYAARTRQDVRGHPKDGWRPEERLSGLETLRGFTEGAAYAVFAEDRRGALREGMDADFVALSVDPVEGEPAQLLSAKVLLNVVAGREVFRAAE